MRNWKKIVTFSLALSLSYAGLVQCFGSFPLTRKTYGFIKGLGNKWVSWIVFLIIMITQIVPWVVSLVDMLVLNSIEFWTGKSVISSGGFDENGKKVVRSGDETAVFTLKKDGREMEVEIQKKNHEKKVLILKKSAPGVVFVQKEGKLEKVSVEMERKSGYHLLSIRQGDRILNARKMSEKEYAELNRRGERYQTRYYAQHPELSATY